jgi:flagellar basal body-associated protein FliL
MMGLDSALAILSLEALGVLTLACVAFFLIARNKRNNEIQAIDDYITQLNENTSSKNQPLDRLLSDKCGLDRPTVNRALQEITDSEKALLQIIIKLFLQREIGLLTEIDEKISNLSEPYCQLLIKMSHGSSNSSTSISNDQGLEFINQQLVRQLNTAMQTIDDITAEYTRVFSGNQTGLELENSRKKMMQIFQDTEHKILHPQE